MSVIAEFSLPAEDLVLGRALQRTSELSVELGKTIPTGNATIPYFWVIGEGSERFDAILEREPELSQFEMIDEMDDRRLYRAEWDRSVDTFVQTVVTHDAVVQEAGGDAESWEFRIRFPDSSHLSGLHTACREKGIDLTVEGIYDPIDPGTPAARGMTEAQWRLVKRAYEEGYFEVPRETTLVEIAEEIGISDQAVNERLRRGLRGLVGATLKSDAGRET